MILEQTIGSHPCTGVLLGAVAAFGCGRSDFGGEPVDPLAQGLVAWYALEELPGSDRFADASTLGLDGVCAAGACPESVAGVVGRGVAVNGSQWFVVPGAPLTAALAAGFSITLWVRRDGGTSILAKPQAAGPGASYELYASDGEIAFCTDAAAASDGEECMGYPYVARDWVHVAMVWDGTAKQLYLDGLEVASTPALTLFDDTDMVVGADREDGSFSTPFAGAIDELRLYRRGLTPDEIATLARR